MSIRFAIFSLYLSHELFKFTPHIPLPDALDLIELEPPIHLHRLGVIKPAAIKRQFVQNKVLCERWVRFKEAADIIWPPS